jgi:acyltransferase-like protein
VDRLPPKWVRRLLVAPLVFVLCFAFLALCLLLLPVAALVDLFVPGSWRTVRMVAFAAFYLVMEIVGLVAMLGLWLRFGFGTRLRTERSTETHYLFMAWWIERMYRACSALFGLKINIEERPTPQPGPLLVFCRHAGPGNSLMLVGTMMIAYGRRPRIVMLAKLQWDPLFDIMGNRLPNRFIKHTKDSSPYVAAIGQLAEGLRDQDAFVLFPEGRDFTHRLRRRAIEFLRDKGFHKHADKAEAMENVLPPRHRGPMAAIESAPGADVVFVAHSVLEEIGTFKDLWRRIPLKAPVDARYWRIPPADVPHTEEETIEWLYSWWERIDGWIAEHKSPEPVKA